MKPQTLHHRISLLFQGYLTQNIEIDDLISGLRVIESQYGNDARKQGTLWFKFSQDDTLSTDINELEKDLSCPVNREFAEERIRETLSLDNDLYIQFD